MENICRYNEKYKRNEIIKAYGAYKRRKKNYS